MAAREESPEAQKMTNRYKDAYRVGGVIVKVGDVIKNIGIVSGVPAEPISLL